MEQFVQISVAKEFLALRRCIGGGLSCRPVSKMGGGARWLGLRPQTPAKAPTQTPLGAPAPAHPLLNGVWGEPHRGLGRG